jgi:hypothetical protein
MSGFPGFVKPIRRTHLLPPLAQEKSKAICLAIFFGFRW